MLERQLRELELCRSDASSAHDMREAVRAGSLRALARRARHGGTEDRQSALDLTDLSTAVEVRPP